jgi:hypothetical protein
MIDGRVRGGKLHNLCRVSDICRPKALLAVFDSNAFPRASLLHDCRLRLVISRNLPPLSCNLQSGLYFQLALSERRLAPNEESLPDLSICVLFNWNSKTTQAVCGTPHASATAVQGLPEKTRSACFDLSTNRMCIMSKTDSQLQKNILLASGSEVSFCIEAQENLLASGIRTRVVSMPCWELFEQQSTEYREAVLPSADTRRIAVEQASTSGWERYVGFSGRIIGMHTFGASAAIKALQDKFGFRPDHIVATALDLISES